MINQNIKVLIYEFEEITKQRTFFEWIRFIGISAIPHGGDVLLGNCIRKKLVDPIYISKNSGIVIAIVVFGWIFALFAAAHIDPPEIIKMLVKQAIEFITHLLPIGHIDILGNIREYFNIELRPDQIVLAPFYSHIMSAFLGALLVLNCEADLKKDTFLSTKINNISRNYAILLLLVNRKINIMDNQNFFNLTKQYKIDFKRIRENQMIITNENADKFINEIGKITFNYIKSSIDIIRNELDPRSIDENLKLLFLTLKLDISIINKDLK